MLQIVSGTKIYCGDCLDLFGTLVVDLYDDNKLAPENIENAHGTPFKEGDEHCCTRCGNGERFYTVSPSLKLQRMLFFTPSKPARAHLALVPRNHLSEEE